VCNMSIEAGARAGMIAPDEVTFAYLEGRPRAPAGAAWTAALERWRTFRSDPTARYDAQVLLDAAKVGPQVTWGTTPGMVADITARVPDPAQLASEGDRQGRGGRTHLMSPAMAAAAAIEGRLVDVRGW
jgi:3-isopropylmalate/(R)-2-methylmalate dehydratase large subunit